MLSLPVIGTVYGIIAGKGGVMARRDKRIARMRDNPRNVRPDELDAVMRGAGFEARQRGTSHKYYTNGVRAISVPQRTPHLKPEYVEQALDLLDAALAETQQAAPQSDVDGDEDE